MTPRNKTFENNVAKRDDAGNKDFLLFVQNSPPLSLKISQGKTSTIDGRPHSINKFTDRLTDRQVDSKDNGYVYRQ